VSDTNAEKKTLYDRVARLVRSNPEAFRAIGEQFDHGESGYSDRAMRQRLAKAKKAFHARGRAARHASTEHRTRAFWRKHADLKGRCENPWSKPRSKADRFIEAWQETLATLDECPLDRRVRADREVMAGRVALMTWLLVDPDADSFEIPITEFQHWTWNALGGKEPRKIALWVEGTAKGVSVDETAGRYHKRCTLLDRDEDRWLPHLRAAVKIVTDTIASKSTNGTGMEKAAMNSRCAAPTNPQATPPDYNPCVPPAPTGSGEPHNPATGDPTTHSPDFTSVDWFGKRYNFSKGNQAQAVRVLWDAWTHGEHSLSQETVGARIESSADRFEMRKTFRRRKANGKGYEPHPAWGTMIQQDGKGCFRLARPKSG